MLRYNLLFLIGYLIVSSNSVHAESTGVSARIAAILLDDCQACHGAKKAEGGYRVDTFQSAIAGGDSGSGFVAGDLDQSEAFRRVISDDESERMPLDRQPLSKSKVGLLKEWIEGGAKLDGSNPEQPISTIVATNRQPIAPVTYQFPVPITSLIFSHDGRRLYVGGYHEITVWNTATGKLVQRISNASQRTMGMALSADDNTLVTAGGVPGKYGAIRFFDRKSGRLEKVVGAVGDLIHDVDISPDGKRFVAVDAESRLQVFDFDGTSPQLSLASHSDWVTAVSWSPDGSKIVTSSRDKTCKVIDVKNGDLLASYTGHGKPVRDVLFHSNGAEVLSAGADNKVHRWKVADSKKTSDWTFADDVYRVVRHEQTLFATSADKTVRQYDLAAKKEIRQFRGHIDRPISLSHHAETNRIATGTIKGEIRIWNTSDGSLVVRFFAAPGFAMAEN